MLEVLEEFLDSVASRDPVRVANSASEKVLQIQRGREKIGTSTKVARQDDWELVLRLFPDVSSEVLVTVAVDHAVSTMLHDIVPMLQACEANVWLIKRCRYYQALPRDVRYTCNWVKVQRPRHLLKETPPLYTLQSYPLLPLCHFLVVDENRGIIRVAIKWITDWRDGDGNHGWRRIVTTGCRRRVCRCCKQSLEITTVCGQDTSMRDKLMLTLVSNSHEGVRRRQRLKMWIRFLAAEPSSVQTVHLHWFIKQKTLIVSRYKL